VTRESEQYLHAKNAHENNGQKFHCNSFKAHQLSISTGNSCVAGCSVEINQDKPNSIFFTFLPSLIPVHGLLRQKQDYHHSVKAPESLYTTYLNYIIFIVRPMGCSKNSFQIFRDAVQHVVPLS
jgi:hypothetical protein